MWQLVTATGGGIALTFIVGIAVGVLALTLLYIASAVVVLERFARAARSPGWVVGFGCATAFAVGTLGSSPRLLAGLGGELEGLTVAVIAAAAVIVTGAAVGGCWLALRYCDASQRGTAVFVSRDLGMDLFDQIEVLWTYDIVRGYRVIATTQDDFGDGAFNTIGSFRALSVIDDSNRAYLVTEIADGRTAIYSVQVADAPPIDVDSSSVSLR